MSKHTIFICIGGTGIQVGTTFGTLYPLLKASGLAHDEEAYKMFIMDKDVLGGNYTHCVATLEHYKQLLKLLPSEEVLPPYELKEELYQELQKEKNGGKKPSDYTVMNLLGDEDLVKDLADMCWREEKQNERLSEGNNRDPSRGALDAYVSLKYLPTSSLFDELKKRANDTAAQNIRLVVLAGVTGGMGSSLIIPFVEEIRSSLGEDSKLQNLSKLRIDLVLIGPYFTIPINPDEKKVDDIGSTQDSYYRAREQLQELRALIKKEQSSNEDWFIYYVGNPNGFDDICGKFKKNGAEKRLSHLVELAAALGALELSFKDSAGFYTTDLRAKEGGKNKIDWDRIPKGIEIKKQARIFMKLIVIVATQVYPRLSQEVKDLKKDIFIKTYVRSIDKNMELIGEVKTKIKEWLTHAIPYFNFWNEIQLFSKLGGNEDVSIEFFDKKDMEKLAKFFLNIIEEPYVAWEKEPLNILPLCQSTWMNYLVDIAPTKKVLSDVWSQKDGSEALTKLIIKNVYEVLKAKKEN